MRGDEDSEAHLPRILGREHTMSLWLTILLGVGILAAIIAVIKRRASGVTTLRIDH
jgi:hypothetical protein